MKRFIALCMTGIMLMSSPVLAGDIIYNGEAIGYSSQKPVIIDGTTYVPIRDVFEALGFEVEWVDECKIATLSGYHHGILLTADTSKMFITDYNCMHKAKKLENEVKIINGRTMLPLREILEAVGYELEWDSATKTTTIIDVNDYDAIESAIENQMTIQTLMAYEVDTTRDKGTLTDEEKAYIENYVEAGKESFFVKYDEAIAMPADELKKTLEENVKVANAKLDKVPCPDSLKEFDKAVKESNSVQIGYSINFREAYDLLDYESEDAKDYISYCLMEFTIDGMNYARIASKIPLSKFFTERNIDAEAELGEEFANYYIFYYPDDSDDGMSYEEISDLVEKEMADTKD